MLPNNKQLTDHQQAFSLTEFPANLMLAGQCLECKINLKEERYKAFIYPRVYFNSLQNFVV